MVSNFHFEKHKFSPLALSVHDPYAILLRKGATGTRARELFSFGGACNDARHPLKLSMYRKRKNVWHISDRFYD